MITPTHLRHLEQLHNAAPIGLRILPDSRGVNERVLDELCGLGLATYDVKHRTYRITDKGENIRRQCIADGVTR